LWDIELTRESKRFDTIVSILNSERRHEIEWRTTKVRFL
jgi:hypothetical protein